MDGMVKRSLEKESHNGKNVTRRIHYSLNGEILFSLEKRGYGVNGWGLLDGRKMFVSVHKSIISGQKKVMRIVSEMEVSSPVFKLHKFRKNGAITHFNISESGIVFAKGVKVFGAWSVKMGDNDYEAISMASAIRFAKEEFKKTKGIPL